MKAATVRGFRVRWLLLVGLAIVVSLGLLTWSSDVSRADPSGPQGRGHAKQELRKGEPALPQIPSKPLGESTLPERKFKLTPVYTQDEPPGQERDDEVPPGQEKKQPSPEARSLTGQLELIPTGYFVGTDQQAAGADLTAVESCPTPTIDLKLLVIAADPTDTLTTLPAIRQALDYLGTPYTVWTATPKPADASLNRLTSMLASGCHAFYQGVILGNGDVAYHDGSIWVGTALTAPEWQTLWDYEATFGIRQVSWYTYPSATYGLNPFNAAFDSTTSPVSASLTTAGRSVFSYINPSNPLTISGAWTYLATPLATNTTPLLSDSKGNALAAVRLEADSTESLAFTFDNNFFLTHSLALSYGAVNWVTKGLFLGDRHIYIDPQPDDLFIADDIWPPSTPCGTVPDTTGVEYRITGADLTQVLTWQAAKRAQATTAQFMLEIPYNGEGTSPPYNPDDLAMYSPDTLTPLVHDREDELKWISHTYTHENLDAISYANAMTELTKNQETRNNLGLSKYSIANLITPDVSGLVNGEFLRAAWDFGIRYVVSDTSRTGYNNPSPNAGIYNQLQPGILMVPRRPTNLFYNVSTPDEWAAEYNCLYRSFWERDLLYDEILDKESALMVTYLLKGDVDPLMFHQSNLRAYDGTRSLLGDLLDRTFQKYSSLFNLPIKSPTMNAIGVLMSGRMAYNNSGVTGSYIPGQSITVSVAQAAKVPVTGLFATGAELYGGQRISYIQLGAGQSSTLPLAVGMTVSKTPDAGLIYLGQTAQFTITVVNTATVAASNVLVTDFLPTGAGLNWTENSANCAIASGTMTCSYASIAAGASRTVTLSSPTTTAGLITNSAQVTVGGGAPASDAGAITVSASTPPACTVPTLSGTDSSSTGGGNITLSWSAPNAATYRLQRRNVGSTTWSTVTTTAATAWSGTETVESQYRVRIQTGTCSPVPGPYTAAYNP